MSRQRLRSEAQLRAVAEEMSRNITIHYNDDSCGLRSMMTGYSFTIRGQEVPVQEVAHDLDVLLDELAELRAKVAAGRKEALNDIIAFAKKEIYRGAQ